MISKLHLKNVKTHKDTLLEFSSGVNVITGDTGQGKTNILLAGSWIKDNRPLGTGCIRRGQEAAIATMEVVTGKDTWGVTRKRSKSENTYGVEKNGTLVGEPFTAFGQSPPKVVLDILNLSDINIQKQRDSHFLVYSPPGQIATFIRSITKLDEIDRVTKLLSGKIRTKRTEISYCQGELESANKKLAILNEVDLELLERLIDKAKDRISKNEEIIRRIEQVESIVNTLKVLEKNRIVLPDNLDQIFEDVEKYTKASISISERILMLKVPIAKINKLKMDRVVLPEDLTILATVESEIEKHDKTCVKMDMLLELADEIRSVGLKIDGMDRRLKQLMDEEKELMEKLDICPSCGVELTEESKKVLLGK
jgi:exonuclease SbcC